MLSRFFKTQLERHTSFSLRPNDPASVVRLLPPFDHSGGLSPLKKEVLLGIAVFLKELPIHLLLKVLEKSIYSFLYNQGYMARDLETILATDYLPIKWTESKLLHALVKNIVGPIVEELIFRGLLMPLLQKVLEKAGVEKENAQLISQVGSSAAFSFIHAPGDRLSSFFGGMIYGELAILSNSVRPSSIAHITHNSMASLASKIS